MTEKNTRLINQIQDLENKLRSLRLELATEEENTTDELKVGDEVTIKNPSKGQVPTGILTKVNRITNRGTVKTKNDRGKEIKVVRKLSNLRRS